MFICGLERLLKDRVSGQELVAHLWPLGPLPREYESQPPESASFGRVVLQLLETRLQSFKRVALNSKSILKH